MKRDNQNHLDRQLLEYYQEEARLLKLPERQRCWQDFQEMLNKENQDRLTEPFPALPRGSASIKERIFRFANRRRSIAALVAASFLIVILLSGTSPMQSLRQAITGPLPVREEAVMEVMATREAGVVTEAPQPMPPGDVEVFADKAAEQFGILQADKAVPAVPADEQLPRGAEPAPREAAEGFQLPVPAAAAEVREQVYTTLLAYRTALQGYAKIAPRRILSLAVPPKGYTFGRAIIFKTGTFFSGTRQEFIDAAGNELIVQQMFAAPLREAAPAQPGIGIPAKAQPEQPAPAIAEKKAAYAIGYRKYTVSMENGVTTLKYDLGDSELLLSAALNKERLLQISAQLVEWK